MVVMQKNIIKVILFLFVLLGFCSCLMVNHSKREKMSYYIKQTDSLNREHRKMPASKRMTEVANFFDISGNDKEKASAFYLLGCSFRDEGEMPLALENYNKALVFLTEATDSCMFALKARIFGQKAELFIRQFLPKDAIEADTNAYKCALLAKDTLSAAIFLSYASSGYNMLGNFDEALRVTEKSVSLLKMIGQKQLAAFISGTMFGIYVKQGNLQKAKSLMHIYEKTSGLFDKYGHIAKGYEIFYYNKGMFCLKSGQFGAAEKYFRQTLWNNESSDCQEAGNHGLYLLYKKIGIKDSLAKYADLAYQINDKRMLQLSSHEMQNMQQFYNYARYQKLANKKIEESSFLKLCLIGVSFLVAVCIFCLVLWYKHKKVLHEKVVLTYKNKVELLVKAKEHRKLLQEHQIEEITKKNEELIMNLKKQLANIISDAQLRDEEAQASDICRVFRLVGQGHGSVSDKDWISLETYLFRLFPMFCKKILAFKTKLPLDDFRMCLLIRLGFAPYEISNILDMKSSNVTMKRKRMLGLMFGLNGKAKMFDEQLRHLN